jgi:uncharacterized protein YxjI
MSRYVISRKLRSMSGAFDIRDDSGVECFQVHGKLLSLGDKLSLQDANGQELAFIEQRVAPHHLQYDILRSGQLAARVTATAQVRQRLSVETPDGGVIDVTGDILGREYQLVRAGIPVAAISARWKLGAGSYGADIADTEDQVLILAVLIAIEQVHRHQDG